MKCARYVSKAEHHHSELVLTQVSLESGLEFFTLLQQNLVKTRLKIQC